MKIVNYVFNDFTVFMCEIDAVCAACHISKEQKRSYGQAQRAEYTNRTTGTRCDACRKWRQRKGTSINNVSLPNQVSISRQSALDVFRVLHIVGVVKVQDKNEERRLGVMQAALRLVDAAIAYNEGWVELRSSTAELQRRALQVISNAVVFFKIGDLQLLAGPTFDINTCSPRRISGMRRWMGRNKSRAKISYHQKNEPVNACIQVAGKSLAGPAEIMRAHTPPESRTFLFMEQQSIECPIHVDRVIQRSVYASISAISATQAQSLCVVTSRLIAGPLHVAVDIDIVQSPPRSAGQEFHQDEEPQREGLCPIRFHVCLPTSALDATNGIEYQLCHRRLVAATLSPEEFSIHTGSVWHRGLPNTTNNGRCNVFLSYRPIWYNVAYVLGAD